MESCSEDSINRLPDALLGHILSHLSTKEAASTSVLSKRWRYLLEYVPNLEFDDSVYLHPERRVEIPLKVIGEKRKKLSTSFPDFVDRILDLQHKYRLKKLFLKVVDDHDPVDPDCVNPWIHNALSRGVSDLHLVIDLNWASNLTPRIFLTETLVKLRLHIRNGFADVESVYLPKLKVLHLEPVRFEIEKDVEFHRLFSGCPVLEELVLDDIWSCQWASFSVSVTTLKRLRSNCKLIWEHHDEFPTSVSFDTPNLVYLDYTEVLADQYPKVRFDSLVEAKIDLLISKAEFTEDDEDNDVFGNATDFVMGISNVQKLELSASTLKVLTFCCKAIPIFKNLTHLTIWSKPEVGWESLPGLLKNCPKLKTLFLNGLCHKATDRCGDVCLCNREEKAEDFISCLSSSRVKVLKICTNGYEVEKQKEQINHFLATMPHLEQVVVYYDKDLTEMSTQLQMLTTAVSQKCKVRLISVDLNLRRLIPVDLNLASSSSTAL